MNYAGLLVAERLRAIPDFPKPGILFWDIEPVLECHGTMGEIAREIANEWKGKNIDFVAGFDARGFLFGPMIAHELGIGFKQIRKKGKLPGKTASVSYELEYGSAEIEMIDDGTLKGKRVLLFDDLLATGGTALAGVELVEKLGGEVVGFACVTDLPHLGGRGKLWHIPVQSLVTIIGNKPEYKVEYCADMILRANEGETIVLVNRLSNPPGYAMPGGRVESGESVAVAMIREAEEELGCTINGMRQIAVLAERGRDTRGHKVSIVLEGCTEDTEFQGEYDKTEPYECPVSELPPPEAFAFDHGPFVYEQLAK